jgi:hypothetical protein
MTVFNLPMWLIKKINKIRRNFSENGKKVRGIRTEYAYSSGILL